MSKTFEEEEEAGNGGGRSPSLKELARNPMAVKPGGGGVTWGKRLHSSKYLKAVKSGKPQSILKIISSAQGSEVRRTMMYIAREIKTGDTPVELRDQDGEIIAGKEDIKQRWREWKKDFTYRKLSDPNAKNRHSRHIMLSVKCENTPENIRKIEGAAGEFLSKNFADLGYEYVYAVHGTDKDAGHPHVHIVMKQRNNLLNKNLDIGPKDLFLLRGNFSDDLESYGLESAATSRRDHLAAEIITGVERMRASGSRLAATRARVAEGGNGHELEARIQLINGLARLEKKIQLTKNLMGSGGKKEGMAILNSIREGIFRVSPNQRRTYLTASINSLDTSLILLKSEIGDLGAAWLKTAEHKNEAIGKNARNEKAAEKIFYGIEDAKKECLELYQGEKRDRVMGALVAFDLSIREAVGEIEEVDHSLGL